MTDEVQVMTIEEQVAYHLEYDSNPGGEFSQKQIATLTPLCVRAIKIINRHDKTCMDEWIDLPGRNTWTCYQTGVKYNKVPARELVRIYGLNKFLNSTWK